MTPQQARAAYLTRRQFFSKTAVGIGGAALASLLQRDLGAALAGQPARVGGLDGFPQFAPKAKRVIHFFLNGGPSHVDTFDPKPMLETYAGKLMPAENLRTERKTGAAFPSPFKFSKYGQSGLEISELFAKTAAHADSLAVVRSMYAQVPKLGRACTLSPQFISMSDGS